MLNVLALYFAEILETETVRLNDLKKDILDLPRKIEETLNSCESIQDFAKEVYQEHDIFFLGRGIDETVAKEGSLKLKEISYIHSESYAAGELKHGTIALIEKGINVIGIVTDHDLVKKTVSNIEELTTRGAITTVVANESTVKEIDRTIFDNVIVVPETISYLSPIVSIIPLQLLAYYVSKEKGLDVDKPRNLAKSVTVE